MRTRQFRWLFVGILILQVTVSVVFSGEPQTLGASAEWTSDGYRFAGGTAPWALGFAFMIAYIYILLMDAIPLASGKPLPGLLRRFVAFWLDFMLAMFVLGPVVGLLPMLVEWRRTRVFAWTFARTTQAPSDIPVVVLSTVTVFAAMLFYYAVPIFRSKPSPGACIVGYQVVPDSGVPLTMRRALLRSLLGFIAVGGAYVAPFAARDRTQGKFWLDKIFGTRATLLP